MQDYENQSIHGKILTVDEPANFRTMSAFVERHAGMIQREAKRAHFLMLTFAHTPDDTDTSDTGDDEMIWVEMKNRHDIGGANEWHIHPGVAIFSPQQKEAAAATGVSLPEHVHATRVRLGLSLEDTTIKNPSALLALNQQMPAFWTRDISESGHVLILPDNVLHVRETLPKDTTKSAGVLHRKWLKDL